MYELSKVRLYSVGPPGARYEDVTIDLSGAGKPVERPQLDLLEGPAEVRPSPATVLFLENGGGKSVLIKLIFSVMLPGKRQIVGTSNTRVLEKFVERGEVAHVVLEWMHSETGRLLVTGKISEWRRRKNSPDDSLSELWYSMRPGPSMGVTSLPFAEAGENLVTRVFRERLSELAHEDPSLELFWADRHAKWEERLIGLGLDSELFEFQRRMNAGEGEAADAFTFSTDEALVDFLLRAVVKEDDTVSLGDALGEYAKTLSARGALELERDFVAATLERLEELARQHTATEATRRILTVHETQRNQFAASLSARIGQERARHADRRVELDAAEAAVTSAGLEENAARSKLAELTRRIARFRVEEAKVSFDAADRRQSNAKALVDAWSATGPLADWLAKEATATQLRKVLQDRQDVQAAALRVRDERASGLVRALLDAVSTNEKAAGEQDTEAAALANQAKEAQAAYDEALQRSVTAGVEAGALEASVADVRGEVDAAVVDGLIPDPSSVGVTADALSEAAAAAAAERDAQQQRIPATDTAVDDAQAALLEARAKEGEVRAEHDRACAEADKAAVAMGALAGEARLIELVDGLEVVLETDVEVLAERLTEALATVERERTELRVAGAADERARLALADAEDALYPPPPEIEQLVHLLRSEQVQCYSGWDVLADFPDEAVRYDLVARFPHLAAGVLLNDPGDLERARRLVATRGFEPASVIAVASTQSFDTTPEQEFDLTPRGDAGFLVPAKKAYYDHEAARDESVLINQRHVEREGRIGELDERQGVDLTLRTRLRHWRGEYPPGRLAELAGWRTTTARTLADQGQVVRDREAEVGAAKLRREEARRLLIDLTAAAGAAAERASRAVRLRDRVAQAEEWRRCAEQHRVLEKTAKAEAGQQQVTRDEAQAQAGEIRQRADRHRATVERLREEIAEAGGDEKVDPDADPPEHPVVVLRALLQEAQIAYLQAQVGSALLAEAGAAEKAETAAKAALRRYSPAAREQAARLLAGPHGVDAASRAAASATAETDRAEASRNRDGTLRVLAECESQLAGLPVAAPPFVLDEEPADVAHATRLLADTGTSLREALGRVEIRRDEKTVAEEALKRIDEVIAGFSVVAVALSMSDEIEQHVDPVTAEAYSGTPEAAREQNAKLWAAVKDARGNLRGSQKRLQEAAETLRTTVSDNRFHTLVSHVRTQITTVAFGELAGHAATWAAALQPRLRSLSDDLAQSERHRVVIVARLQGMVEHALSTLRQAQRLSRLPAGLGDWSGQEFLRFTFKAIEGEVLAQQLSDVVDAAAGASGETAKRDGMTVLLRAVRAAAPKGFTVTMLKPDAVLRTERVRVSQVRDVFSGGQHLTAAIMLYCTLAALRANSQGRAGRRHSGVLFLDNPIGRASAGYLLDLQRAVASALGVQLVYTTGLFDAEALGAFPLIVRLRNDADLRAGRKYLSVEQQVRRFLGALTEPDGTARLSAGRILLKERSRDQD